MGFNAKIHVFKAYTSIIYRNLRTYTGFLEATRVCIKKYHFKGISRHFLWKLNPSDRTIALTKLLIKPANLDTKETEIAA